MVPLGDVRRRFSNKVKEKAETCSFTVALHGSRDSLIDGRIFT
jgi:hypothetical protein